MRSSSVWPGASILPFFQTRRTFRGAPLSFCHSDNPLPPDPPGLLVQFRTGDSSMIQLTKENEKSEPFSYWKKVQIFRLYYNHDSYRSGCHFYFTPAVPGLAGPGASFCLDAKTNPAPQKTDVQFGSINLSNFCVLFVDCAQNKKRFVSTEKQIIS